MLWEYILNLYTVLPGALTLEGQRFSCKAALWKASSSTESNEGVEFVGLEIATWLERWCLCSDRISHVAEEHTFDSFLFIFYYSSWMHILAAAKCWSLLCPERSGAGLPPCRQTRAPRRASRRWSIPKSCVVLVGTEWLRAMLFPSSSALPLTNQLCVSE